MKILTTGIKDLYEIELEPFVDGRGFFVRSFCVNELSAIKKDIEIVQINHTLTLEKGSVRGLHFQKPPFCEAKFVRCLRGTVFDVAVDLRKGSPFFLKWYGTLLTASNMKMLAIPEGFAHGFQTLESNCELLYLHTECYNKTCESGLRYDDPVLHIDWKLPVSILSDRDKTHPLLDDHFKGIEI